MKNGRDDNPNDRGNDPKITRIEDARRKRNQGKAAAVRESRGSLKEWIFGGVIVAMAIGMVISFGGTVLRTIQSLGG